MHSWRVWVLARAELGTAVFHGFSTQALFCWVTWLPKDSPCLCDETALPFLLQYSMTVGDNVNDDVYP
jgi:hypothetical protein